MVVVFTRGGLTNTNGASAYLDVPKRTLEDWRWKGRGPAFIRVGRGVRYHRDDLDDFIQSHRQTSPAGKGA